MQFDEAKATQTAAAFLRLAEGKLNYFALIKLLYMADREAFKRFGMPITTDRYVSMKLRPVTSNIYDRIKASASAGAPLTLWSAHIKTRGNEAHLDVDPGTSEMSRAENTLISEFFKNTGAKIGMIWRANATNSFRNGPIQAPVRRLSRLTKLPRPLECLMMKSGQLASALKRNALPATWQQLRSSCRFIRARHSYTLFLILRPRIFGLF